MKDRRKTSTIQQVTNFVGAAALLCVATICIISIFTLTISEALVVITSATIGYLGGVLTPTPGHTQSVRVENDEADPVLTKDADPAPSEEAEK